MTDATVLQARDGWIVVVRANFARSLPEPPAERWLRAQTTVACQV